MKNRKSELIRFEKEEEIDRIFGRLIIMAITLGLSGGIGAVIAILKMYELLKQCKGF